MRTTATSLLAAALALCTIAGCDDTPTSPLLRSRVAGIFADGVALEVGEALTVTAEEAQTIFLSGGVNGAEYVYVPFNASERATARLAVEVLGANVATPSGPPDPSRVPGLRLMVPSSPALRPDRDFHRRLREREIRELRPLIGTAARPAAAAGRLQLQSSVAAQETPGIPPDPGVGDVLKINANPEQSCQSPDIREGRVVAISDRAVVVEDVSNPEGGFTPAEYENIAATFDTLIYPVDVRNFGEPVFADFIVPQERIVIFYTRVVNALTPPNSQSLVGGFFFGRDLFPRVQTEPFAACPASNEAPIMYMLAPDPTGEVNENVRTKERVLKATLSTVAHEFQHLINQSRRFFVFQGGEAFEEVWLNEGLSHIAEELMFYHASGLSPRENITVEELRSAGGNAAIDAFNLYQANNIGRFAAYLEDPDTASLLGIDNLPTRGASWAFLRYTADHEDGPDAPLFRSLVDGGEAGVANLQAALTVSPIDLMQTWTVSVYTDDALPNVPFELLYQQPSWNFRNIYRAIFAEYPLGVENLTAEEQTFELPGGGAAFLRFGVPAGQRASIITTAGGSVPGERLRISVIRLR